MQREHPGARAAQRSDDGFTLIELMMVILIIAILIAVLLPTFFGATKRANDRSMQTGLRNALTAAKAVYVDGQDYTLATTAKLNTEGAPVTFIDAAVAPSGPNEVSVDPVSADEIVLAGQSKSGTCFYVTDNGATGTALFAALPGGGGCAAAGAPVSGDPAWAESW